MLNCAYLWVYVWSHIGSPKGSGFWCCLADFSLESECTLVLHHSKTIVACKYDQHGQADQVVMHHWCRTNSYSQLSHSKSAINLSNLCDVQQVDNEWSHGLHSLADGSQYMYVTSHEYQLGYMSHTRARSRKQNMDR